MLIYFWITGIGCLVYYGIIRHYTGKWDSTFAGFWLLSGVLHLGAAFVWAMLPKILQTAGAVLIGAVWCLFLVTELCIFQSTKKKPEKNADYLIVLGAHVNGRRITNSLMRRLDAAYEYLLQNPRTTVIVSGGQGRGEDISEADAMAENLLERGIEEKRIIREDKSVSTEENLRFSGKLILETDLSGMKKTVVVVSNDFHIYRALLLGNRVGYKCLSGLAATSNPVLKLNYLVREFFAIILTKVRAML